MRYSTLLLTLILIAYSTSCVLRGQNQSAANRRPQELKAVISSIPALLSEETHSGVQGTEIKIKGEPGTLFEFTQAQFVSESYGWAMSRGSLYRTTDGGANWELLPQGPEEEASFSSFFFINESRGWLTSVKRVSAKRWGLGRSSVILVTDDGGRSWKPQASFPDEVEILEISFLNANEGMAVGAHVVDGQQVYDELFVLTTSNGGKEWHNVSQAAKATIKEEYESTSDSGKNIQWTSSGALLLTRYGRVISMTDGGRVWELLVNLKRVQHDGIKSANGYVKFVGDAERTIRIVAAGYQWEYTGVFVVQEDRDWRSYEVDLTPVRDALILSNGDVLACGSNNRRHDEKPWVEIKDAGVILRSSDGGKSWQSIYRSKSYETFFYLTKIKDDNFYAVSDTGTFLRFTLPQ